MCQTVLFLRYKRLSCVKRHVQRRLQNGYTSKLKKDKYRITTVIYITFAQLQVNRKANIKTRNETV